jgi:hypothetical protein
MVSGMSFWKTKSCGNVPTIGPSGLSATFPRRRHPYLWVLLGILLPGRQGRHPTYMTEPTYRYNAVECQTRCLSSPSRHELI